MSSVEVELSFFFRTGVAIPSNGNDVRLSHGYKGSTTDWAVCMCKHTRIAAVPLKWTHSSVDVGRSQSPFVC